MPVFGNPLGLLALLGIPAVLAIHFLQRKARELPVSTLFLLDQTRREAASGRRFERLIPSIPLWMQLLAVLLLAWFLAEPRYRKTGSVQRIAVVLDSSASMSVFKSEAIKKISEFLPSLQGPATELQLTLLESVPNRPRLYTGSSLTDLNAALEKWQPRDGPIDPTQSLRLARSLVSRIGSVIYLTDTPTSNLPFEAQTLAVGKPIDNVGFTGVSFATEEGSLVWRALVKNHSNKPMERTWTVQTAAGSSTSRPLQLAPGALVTLQSAFPKDADFVRVVLSSDGFALDDVLPLVSPTAKPISLFASTSPAFSGLAEKLLKALDTAESSNDAKSADLSIASYNPLDPVLPSGNTIVFVEDETRTGAWLKGGIVAEANPLMNSLNWQSLLVRETIQLERKPTDTVLLWQDKRPLIFLRESPNSRQLLFNFDPTLSNADKQPAFIVLLHRFAESIRTAKIAPVSLNLETSQPLAITSAPSPPLTLTATDITGKPLPAINAQFASSDPGFMKIRQGEQTLLTAAVHFGDPREADFSSCASSVKENAISNASIERHTRPDPLWRIWLLLLLAALLISWKYTSRQLKTA
ncbi:MAG: VWA domain-containing protein [Gloeobacteraceae cyanobacterium ES-bin-144]|nr:VWA domain-containing protein [Verrucomicrobiales bacterium]